MRIASGKDYILYTRYYRLCCYDWISSSHYVLGWTPQNYEILDLTVDYSTDTAYVLTSNYKTTDEDGNTVAGYTVSALYAVTWGRANSASDWYLLAESPYWNMSNISSGNIAEKWVRIDAQTGTSPNKLAVLLDTPNHIGKYGVRLFHQQGAVWQSSLTSYEVQSLGTAYAERLLVKDIAITDSGTIYTLTTNLPSERPSIDTLATTLHKFKDDNLTTVNFTGITRNPSRDDTKPVAITCEGEKLHVLFNEKYNSSPGPT